jgi:hypothetical protein
MKGEKSEIKHLLTTIMKEIQLKYEIIVDDLLVFLPFYMAFGASALRMHFSPMVVWIGEGESGIAFVLSLTELWVMFHTYGFCLIVFARAFGVRFMRRERYVPLRRKPTKDIMDKFIADGKLRFAGIVSTYGAHIRNVQHPFDFFVDGLLRKFAPTERDEAISMYKRTNSTLPLRLAQAGRYGRDFTPDDADAAVLHFVKEEILDEFTKLAGFDDFKDNLLYSVGGAFNDLNIDWTAAAGYPYRAGIKRGIAFGDAQDVAWQLLSDDDAFKRYMNDHVWYTTGRAKLQPVDADLSARIICYPGFAAMMLAALYFQPFQKMLSLFDWCAVGMTWTSGGARKFAEYFDDHEGFAPAGYSYCSLDVSSWDSSMGTHLLEELKEFHINVQQAAGVNVGYVARFSALFSDMIHAILVFPLGYAFETVAGMKSGWPNTSHDDTLGHEFIFRSIERDVGRKMKRKLYGDDNFFLLPDDVDIHEIIDGYKKFGMTVKHFNISRRLDEVDFLSKKVRYIDGEYYVYRDTVETIARLLMPEENDPGDREVPNEIVAAERLIGHLFDNPFNLIVRQRIYACLEHLRDYYRIYDVDVSDRMIKAFRWRNVDISRLKNVPIIPSIDFINQLYGVAPIGLNVVWPRYLISIYGIDYNAQDTSKERFTNANSECRRVYNRLYELGRRRRPTCIKYTSPFASPTGVRGYHGARFEFAVRHFGIKYKRVLDFGCHPGACAFSMLKDDGVTVTGVSLVPSRDRQTCPYVLRSEQFKFINEDVNSYSIDENFDLLHDDVDEVIERTQFTDLKYAIAALKRGIKASVKVKQFLMTIHDVDSRVCEEIYNCYRMYGHFDIVRPLYSNPWKCEFMLYFCKSSKPILKKTVFLRALNHFLNSFSADMVLWSEALEANISKMLKGDVADRCPDQDDERLQARYREKLF